MRRHLSTRRGIKEGMQTSIAVAGYSGASSSSFRSSPQAFISHGVPKPMTHSTSRKKRLHVHQPGAEIGKEEEKEEKIPGGVRIRRRPTTGPPVHHVGPFQFRLQNEGNCPRNILEEIVWNTDCEVAQKKERLPLAKLKERLPLVPKARDFIGALKSHGFRIGAPALIAEVKKASPSKGVIRHDFDPVQIAKAYEKGGASCISVVTDRKYFQGSFDNMKAIREAGVKCPLLCKEFIIDAWQLYYARLHGADAVLLSASILPNQDIYYMSKVCKLLQMDALVEVQNEEEIDRILQIDGIKLIGINNQDVVTSEIDINNTIRLLQGHRGQRISERNILVVSKSGFATSEDIDLVQKADVHAVLVGESIVKEDDPAIAIAALFQKDLSVTSTT